MTEQWAVVDGYEGIYAVSDHGNVMSMNYAKSGLPGLMAQRKRRGYPSVFFRRKGEPQGRSLAVHALVARAFIGERPDGFQINHKNGNKADNRVVNLEYCSASDNRRHAYATGLQPRRIGAIHPLAKLDDMKVREIRALLKSGVSQRFVSEKFGVDRSQISRIARNRVWAHVQDVDGALQ